MKLFYATLMAGVIGYVPTAIDACGSSTDADGDGHTVESGTDCDDSDPTVYEGAPEFCDNKDNDCNGAIDDNAANSTTFYADTDGDGFGSSDSVQACSAPAGYVSQAGDCDDSDESTYPGAEETTGDGIDSNCNAHRDFVTTIAGVGGSPGYSGDGGIATVAQLNQPFNTAFDPKGNLLIVDSANHRLRRVDTSGKITTIAGTGTGGYNGDGIDATTAQLNTPKGVVVDSSGVIYVSDTVNQRVRKIDTAGRISTAVGTGVAGGSGDGGPATAATLSYPYGLALDANNNLYVADSNNHRIRLVSGGTIKTIAGNGTPGLSGDGAPAPTAQLNYPRAVALDSVGIVYIADTGNSRIRRIGKDGVITTVAGSSDGYGGDGGPATAAKLNDPYGVTVDRFGNLLVADTDNHRIRQVDTAGIITTVVGTGSAGYSGDGIEDGSTNARLYTPYTATLDKSGNLFIADSKNAAIRKVQW